MLKKLFGNKDFYSLVLKVTLPIMLQQILINIVNLADNLMVGQLSEDIIDGVYIASKIIFVCNLGMFGSVEGAGVFFAQFFGAKDEKHLKQMFNLKLYAILLVGFIAMIAMLFFGKDLALFFVNETQATIASEYLRIYAFSIPFFTISVALATCYREVRLSHIPTIGSVIALFSNIFLNYIFIFVLKLNHQGAAIATVLARTFEFSFIVFYSFKHKPAFLNNIFKKPQIDKPLAKDAIIKSLPLFLNELGWSIGQTMLVFAFSKVSDLASSSLSIATTLFDLFYLATLSLGIGISVILGNELGDNKFEQVKKEVAYFLTLTVLISAFLGGLLAVAAPFVSGFYNISDESRLIAIRMCYSNALLMPLLSINCSIFFSIRSGGMTYVVIIFDTAFVWLIQVPVSLLLATKTNLALENVFFLTHFCEIIKVIVGFILLKSGIWIRNITSSNDKEIMAN